LRLSKKKIEIIKYKVETIFGKSITYLFGSRVNDEKSGGDIDLYIVSENKENLFQKKARIKILLEDTLYKPVDIIIGKDKNRLIEKEALKGVVL